MVTRINIWIMAFALAFFPTVASAQSPQVRQLLLKPSAASAAAAGYTGPGDVVSGALGWYSCSRGYNTADTANACNVCLPADTTCADITLSAGFAVLPGSLSTCNITTVICTVKISYDKSGNGRNISQATEANRPTFRPAMASNLCPTTALPCMKFSGGQNLGSMAGTAVTQAQQYSQSMVVFNTTGNSQDIGLQFNTQFLFDNGTNGVLLFAGSSSAILTGSAGNSWHAVQGVWNGASSVGYSDGTTTSSLNPGAGGFSAVGLTIGNVAIAGNFNGFLGEIGLWPGGFNGTQAGNMNTNQHGANGYNF